MLTQPDRLRVFISSRMHELKDLRAILRLQLEQLGIDAFVYEADKGAYPDDPEQVSLGEVERTDVLALVIGESYGEITEREYEKARELNKPCLVYERLGRTTTEPELDRFLKKLSGPRGVPSRTTFQNAVDLAEKLANDVQAWLVREYRRLSAAEMTAGESSRRRAELGATIQRLSASTKQHLPQGNSSDLLAWQLQQWFEALEYPLDEEPALGPDHTDLVVRVPARRRQYVRVLVRAKDGEIQSPDVTAARGAARERSLDEVWLVSFRRVSPAARRVAEAFQDTLLYTLDELIEEDVDFERYFEWLERQVQAANIDRFYEPPAVTINEVDSSGALHAESTYDTVASYVDQWLEDNDGEHLSLLGEFGTGKSWFALKYAHDKVRDYREAQQRGLGRPRVALVVRLREYARGFKDVGSLLTEFVFREHQINIRSFAVLEALNRMGRLLFIFDGFDEMAARVDQQKMVDNFWSLASVLGPGSKAILTCRTEYFQFAKQAREILSGKLRGSSMRDIFETTRFQVATIQMFDEARLRAVLSRRSADQKLIDTVLSNQKLLDLGRRPVMIDLLIEAMPSLEADRADLSHVYYNAVHRKMERDIALGRTFTSMADKIFFMCEIAWEMLSNRQLKIHYKEIPEKIRDYFGTRVSTTEEDHWRHDLLSQTMLVRDDEGYYRPAHKSLIEFFSAYKLSAEIGALKDEYVQAARGHANVNDKRPPARQRWSAYFRESGGGLPSLAPLERFATELAEQLAKTWGRLTLDNAISELILSLCGRDALLDFVKKQTSSDEREGRTAARALEVAAFSGDLAGSDLAGAVLTGCRLSECDLTGANLSGSAWSNGHFELVSLDRTSLVDARFRKTRLSSVTLRGADLSNCWFDDDSHFEVRVVAAAWCTHADQESLVVALADGRVAAVTPLHANMCNLKQIPLDNVEKAGEGVATQLAGLQGTWGLPELGQVSFSRSGWQCNANWEKGTVAEGITAELSTTSHAGGDVEQLHVKVSVQATGKVLLNLSFYDASDRGSAGKRALAIAKSGKLLAVVSASSAGEPESAEILADDRDSNVSLRGFIGVKFVSGPETIDKRGAAFSPSGCLLAICERPHSVGFWRTADGAFVGRVVFQPPGRGAVLDGAVGLPPAFTYAVSVGSEGWMFEGPDE